MFSRTFEGHLRHLTHVLELLKRAYITLKLFEYAFFLSRVNYLGYILSPGKLAVSDSNKEGFRKAVFPRYIGQFRLFLDALNVYRHFITAFSLVARPLSRML